MSSTMEGRKVPATDGGKTTKDDKDVNNDDDIFVDGENVNAELEARAISQAIQSADAAYVPSPSLLASDDPSALLNQVDGPSLVSFDMVTPSVYQAKSVPVALRSRFDVPIHVIAGGSIVEYVISTDTHDIAFGVTADREEGTTIVKEISRVDSHIEPVTGKFLVGSVPCALIFAFDNEYSWFREKRVTYKIVVTPPKIADVINGRRLRAKKALEVVTNDGRDLDVGLKSTSSRLAETRIEVERLERALADARVALRELTGEEEALVRKYDVRSAQIKMLTDRLENGWDDEKIEV